MKNQEEKMEAAVEMSLFIHTILIRRHHDKQTLVEVCEKHPG